ncbi:MAG TPA: hypothetical protein VJB12_00130 [Candidatus Nanoarchaeia archaeon]|nr:hypothetical protein [Candidatus Nanoarchaeia archaeon]
MRTKPYNVFDYDGYGGLTVSFNEVCLSLGKGDVVSGDSSSSLGRYEKIATPLTRRLANQGNANDGLSPGRILTFPETIDEILTSRENLPPQQDPLIGKAFHTDSSVWAGYNDAGNPIVVVSHLPTLLSNPDYLESRLKAGAYQENQGLDISDERGREEFSRLQKLRDDKRVFVLSEEATRKLAVNQRNKPEGIASVVSHPLVSAAFGDGERIERYFTFFGEHVSFCANGFYGNLAIPPKGIHGYFLWTRGPTSHADVATYAPIGNHQVLRVRAIAPLQ